MRRRVEWRATIRGARGGRGSRDGERDGERDHLLG